MTPGLAERFDRAQRDVFPIDPPPETAVFSASEAYAAQHELVALRLARGELPVGIKLGFTSATKMAQMGLHEAIAGQLTDVMRVPDRARIGLSAFIAPRIEPELAFRLARDVDPTDPAVDLLRAIDAVAPALDIIDSRVRAYAFDLGAVIADNASAAGYVIGPWCAWHPGIAATLPNLAVSLLVDGRRQAVGSSAAILGDPLRALPALQRIAARHGLPLRAGDVVLAGAATASIPLVPGFFETRIAGLGSVGIEVTHG